MEWKLRTFQAILRRRRICFIEKNVVFDRVETKRYKNKDSTIKGEIAARGRRLGRKRRGMFYWKGGARDRSAS